MARYQSIIWKISLRIDNLFTFFVFIYNYRIFVTELYNMTTGTKKYQDIINTGKLLFWKYGMKRVTVEEICAEAGASKMTFYKYFGNKEELALHVIRTFWEQSIGKFKRLMDSDIDFKDKVREAIQMKMDGAGDISKEFLSDLYQGDYPEIKGYIEKITGESLRMVMGYYQKAQERGEIRKEVKIEFMMYLLNRMIEMASDERLVSMYDSGGALVMELTNFFFYGVLPQDNPLS